MRRSLSVLVGALVVCVAPVCQDATGAEPKTVVGAGLVSCGAWTADTSNVGLRNSRTAWVLGFISRAAFEHTGDILEPTDALAVMAWVDKYCRENPLDRLGRAAGALETELAARVDSQK